MFENFLNYSATLPIRRVRSGKSGRAVLHQRTCPVCGRQLVNLYKQGDVWKCRRCWEEVKQK